MESFSSVLGCVALPIGAIVVIGIAIWMFRANLGDAKRFNQERQAQIYSIRSKGISSQAVIVSAKYGIDKGAKSNQRMLVKFDVKVQPDGRSPFRTKFKDWMYISPIYCLCSRDRSTRRCWSENLGCV